MSIGQQLRDILPAEQREQLDLVRRKLLDDPQALEVKENRSGQSQPQHPVLGPKV